jgi:hypothetical protein
MREQAGSAALAGFRRCVSAPDAKRLISLRKRFQNRRKINAALWLLAPFDGARVVPLGRHAYRRCHAAFLS